MKPCPKCKGMIVLDEAYNELDSIMVPMIRCVSCGFVSFLELKNGVWTKFMPKVEPDYGTLGTSRK